MVIDVEAIYPLNWGTGTFTSHETSEKTMDVFEAYPELEEGTSMLGWIHTHHNMGAFFSGTDNADLFQNTPNYPFYLSLIVDFKCQPVAKLCYIVKGESPKYTVKHKGKEVKLNVNNKTVEYLAVADCEINYELDVAFLNACEEITANKEKEKEKTKIVQYSPSKVGVGEWESPSKSTKAQDDAYRNFLISWITEEYNEKKLKNTTLFVAIRAHEHKSIKQLNDFSEELSERYDEAMLYNFGTMPAQEEVNMLLECKNILEQFYTSYDLTSYLIDNIDEQLGELAAIVEIPEKGVNKRQLSMFEE